MSVDEPEYQMRKKAIFDGMSERGQKRILKIGYENWDPFMEPKDPRERMFSAASGKARALVDEFYASREGMEESVPMHRELFELCKGYIQGETRSQVIFDFCAWYLQKNR